MSTVELSEDAHNRVAVLFTVPGTIGHKETSVAVSIKWLLTNGIPTDPETKEPFAYEGTFIIQ